jgi:multiple sugar transport system permease protein
VSSVALPDAQPAMSGPPKKGVSPWQKWGMILIAPYAMVFAVFVVYPVCYGLWLARHPSSYEALF